MSNVLKCTVSHTPQNPRNGHYSNRNLALLWSPGIPLFLSSFDWYFCFLFSVLVTVHCPLLHRQGVSHTFLDVFFCYSPLLFWFWPRKWTQKYFWLIFIFFLVTLGVHCVSSAVHSFSSCGTTLLETQLPCHCRPRKHTQERHWRFVNLCVYLNLNPNIKACYVSELQPALTVETKMVMWFCKWTTNQNWLQLLLFQKEKNTHMHRTHTYCKQWISVMNRWKCSVLFRLFHILMSSSHNSG